MSRIRSMRVFIAGRGCRAACEDAVHEEKNAMNKETQERRYAGTNWNKVKAKAKGGAR